ANGGRYSFAPSPAGTPVAAAAGTHLYVVLMSFTFAFAGFSVVSVVVCPRTIVKSRDKSSAIATMNWPYDFACTE
ncbi:MAG: hypothetical protein P4L40_07460, partial [Terracidiphilus sp.]|nr:hypothetical protein [Terracidiphilus sp.]